MGYRDVQSHESRFSVCQRFEPLLTLGLANLKNLLWDKKGSARGQKDNRMQNKKHRDSSPDSKVPAAKSDDVIAAKQRKQRKQRVKNALDGIVQMFRDAGVSSDVNEIIAALNADPLTFDAMYKDRLNDNGREISGKMGASD